MIIGLIIKTEVAHLIWYSEDEAFCLDRLVPCLDFSGH